MVKNTVEKITIRSIYLNEIEAVKNNRYLTEDEKREKINQLQLEIKTKNEQRERTS